VLTTVVRSMRRRGVIVVLQTIAKSFNCRDSRDDMQRSRKDWVQPSSVCGASKGGFEWTSGDLRPITVQRKLSPQHDTQ
jgi:hypothetical protein